MQPMHISTACDSVPVVMLGEAEVACVNAEAASISEEAATPEQATATQSFVPVVELNWTVIVSEVVRAIALGAIQSWPNCPDAPGPSAEE